MADKKERRVIKKGVGIPTVPVSADHRNGDWLVTDIYEGEFYQNTTTGFLYTRTPTGIVKSETLVRSHSAKLLQSGVNIPSSTVCQSTLLGTVTYARSVAGSYTLTTSVANFTAGKTIVLTGGSIVGFVTFEVTSTTVITIQSYNIAGVQSDNIITCDFKIEISE